MEEIEFVEKYMVVYDKDGNKSHIKLSETQKRFLEYIRKCNVKSLFASHRELYKSHHRSNLSWILWFFYYINMKELNLI